MKNIDIIICGIRPYIQFNNSYTSMQCIYDGNLTTIAT